MTWQYKEALFYGTKTNPKPGDSVTVVLENDAEESETKEFTYGYDGSKSKAQFVAMVKQEVKAHLQHLNTAVVGGDATSEFSPT